MKEFAQFKSSLSLYCASFFSSQQKFMEIIIYILLAIAVFILFLLLIINSKLSNKGESVEFKKSFEQMKEELERLERKMREEFSLNRDEVAKSSRHSREEQSNSFKLFIDQFQNEQKDFADQLAKLTKLNDEKMEFIRNTVDKKLESIQLGNEKKLAEMRVTVDEKLDATREEVTKNSKLAREELNNSFKLFNDQLQNGQKDFADQLAKLTKLNDEKMEFIRTTVDKKLDSIQLGNEKKLEEMRVTVDEKLHSTLEKRLGDSFKIVSERLELVHKGLGEMQNLATGVGDLKKVLSNVKTRGTWGEMQLENAIEQILSPEQYLKNVSTKKGSNDKVEFAIKMPGRNNSSDGMTLLPIDAKFPIEDYQRLIDASERGDIQLIDDAGKSLENRIKLEAKTIHEKYIDPPNTTDVAILFLPVEGLFAEVLRRPGLFEKIQNEFKVTIAGPTTLIAILNSLQMGFRTLAIEKRSSEVWTLLSVVKNEFSKFGTLLENTQKKLETASKSIELAAQKSRTIEKKLNKVQQLPESSLPTTKLIDNE